MKSDLRSCNSWEILLNHVNTLGDAHLSSLFQDDPDRFNHLSFRHSNILLDLSKHRITNKVLNQLLELASERQLPDMIEGFFQGDKVNQSENRPALHTALRLPAGTELLLNNENIVEGIHQNLSLMEKLVNEIHSGQWRGYSGESIDTVVNIGVGGSDLGPMMTCRALAEHAPKLARKLNIHFVSSMDGSQLAKELRQLSPERTLFIIASKSFSTIDTMANAATARAWLEKHTSAPVETLLNRHFIGVSAAPERMSLWGIKPDHQLRMWEWVGGRYSMWSAIGLPIALKIGFKNFTRLLNGAHTMDQHFRSAEMSENLPVLLAMTEIWNINFLNIKAHAILPYDGRLKHLPAYLEQLQMESNGKSTTQSDKKVDYHTCPVLWGDVGPNAQHAFYQLLHQGTESVMCDFITSARRYTHNKNVALDHQHNLALANFLAQSRLLAFGNKALTESNKLPNHKRYDGNQPSSSIILDELTPESFGQLIALYEHKVFVQAVIWNINPFDQWGVEQGKIMATDLMPSLIDESDRAPNIDSSTKGLIEAINQSRKENSQ